MQVVQISDAHDLGVLAERWNELADGNPFRAWDWLEGWWRKCGATRDGHGESTLFVLTVEQSGELWGIAPWFVHDSPWSGRTLRFLGTGEVCSDYLGLLARPGTRDAVAPAIADWLSHEAADRWDLIELTELDGNDSVIAALANAMSSRGCTLDWRPGARCWRIELPATWGEYIGALSKSHRKQVRRMERRLFETQRARLYTASSQAELGHAMNLLVTLHQRRQRSLGRAGCFASSPFLNFHTEVSRRFFNRGRLRLHWLELDGQPVAAEYHLAGDRGVFVYQGGIEPAALAESPGQLITLATLKLAIEQGYQFFDFLRGDEEYKAHWRAVPRPTMKLRIVPNRLSTRLRHNIWVAARGFQSLVRGDHSLPLLVGD